MFCCSAHDSSLHTAASKTLSSQRHACACCDSFAVLVVLPCCCCCCLQGNDGDAGVLYDGLVARVEDELDLFEALPQLLEQQQQQQEASAATDDAAGSAAWLQLVRG
jgi:hypothetical protein